MSPTGWRGATDVDVVVVGFGPVGQVMTLLLAAEGRRVLVLERWLAPYPMPRAVSFDGESARILAAAGIGPDLPQVGECSRDYVWQNGEGTVLFEVDVAERGRSGWPDSTSVYQPGLEAALAARAAAAPGVAVRRGCEVTGLADRGDHVVLRVRRTGPDGGGDTVTARWVVGCDGANSGVREAAGITLTDHGFFDDWLTCDVTVHDDREFAPNNLQVCDPVRPRTAVSAGPGHRRWEFMRLPDEPRDEFGGTDSAWRLLGLFDLHPGNATLERHAVYTFQARYADRWRAGRVLLAGDAAHLMPPFAGQGMCSGFRDAANLAWKLDLVLRGAADEVLLDSYTTERRRHVQHAIGMSMNLGRVICQTDPKAARDRDTAMAAARATGRGSVPEPAVTALTDGVLRRDRTRLGGLLSPQGRVRSGAVTGLFDEVVGTGFALLGLDPPERSLDPVTWSRLDRLGARTVHLVGPGRPAADGDGDPHPGRRYDTVVDLDGTYLSLLSGAGARAVLVRPDFYVFGGATDPASVPDLVADLDAHLGPERHDER